MTSRRKTDGERLARRMAEGWCDDGAHIRENANAIDRLIRRRMAEAWDQGNACCFRYGELSINPYRGRKKK